MVTYPNDVTNFTQKPDRSFGQTTIIPVSEFESQAGYKKRRLLSRKKKRTWELTYTGIRGTDKANVEAFYDARFGSFESFTLDLDHLSLTGNAIVHFSSEIQIGHIGTKDGTELNTFYTVGFTLEEIDD